LSTGCAVNAGQTEISAAPGIADKLLSATHAIAGPKVRSTSSPQVRGTTTPATSATYAADTFQRGRASTRDVTSSDPQFTFILGLAGIRAQIPAGTDI